MAIGLVGGFVGMLDLNPEVWLFIATLLVLSNCPSVQSPPPVIMNFATLAKDLRISRGLTLRQFCAEAGLDPSNWSKVERAVIPPPGDEPTLKVIAGVLGLKGEERQKFFDQASLARHELPADIADDEKVLAALPAFFRAARGSELDDAALKQFVEDVRALHGAGPKKPGK